VFRWIVRAGLIRVLGRRVIPLLFVYDGVRLVRSLRRRWTDPGPPP
jgi:hypothetical protein